MTVAEILALAKAQGVTIRPDGDDLDVVADRQPDPDLLATLAGFKAEILAKLGRERLLIVRWINANFSSSAPNLCRHCGWGPKVGNAWVRLHCGDDSRVVHQSCWPAWKRAAKIAARLGLGLEP
jgi:hypothetical protein